jgi:type II secretory pathway component PulK
MRRERGAALPLAMLLVLATAALSGVLVQRDRVIVRDGATDAQALAALHAVEGGLDRARHALARDAGHAGGSARIGSFDVAWTVTREAQGGWRVRVRTEDGGGHLDARLLPTPGLPRTAR